MNTYWLYPLHALALAGGCVMLWWLARGDVAWRVRAVVVAVMCAVFGGFMFHISEPPDLFADFYKAYYPAAQAVLGYGDGGGLEASMREGASGFVNLPVLAWLFAPFGLLPSGVAGYAFLVVGLAATTGAWFLLSRLADLDRERSLLLLLLFVANGPLFNSLREGNTTHMVLFLLVLGIRLLRWNRDFAAGLVFGLAALVKLPLLLLGVYFVARGRWRAGVGGLAACGLAAALSVWMFGWDLHVFWYEHSIKPFAENPLGAFNVQSVHGFFSRLQHGGQYLKDWEPHALAPAFGVGAQVSVWLLSGAVAFVFGWPLVSGRERFFRSPGSSILELEICIVVLLAMMVSTVSWTHYYLWMLLPCAYVAGGVPKVLGSWKYRIPAGLALLGAMPPVLVLRVRNPGLAEVYGYFAVSHYLVAAVLLFAVLLVADWNARRR